MNTVPQNVKGHILLVDDDATTLLTMQTEIRGFNYDVIAAHSGHAALEVLKTESVDILVVDVCMPEMSGFEFFEHAQKIRPDVQCIFMTAYGDVDKALKAAQLGAFNYLLKPIHATELQHLLDTGMERVRKSSRSAATADDPKDAPPLFHN